jgi:ATP-dependent DNA helicase
VKKVNSLKLQNTVMQLRKVCSHPYLFDWPQDQDTHEPIVDEQLVNASGKMMILERLLDELFKRGHKVLLFSQFTTMLDIIEVRVFLAAYTGCSEAIIRNGPKASKDGRSAG